LLHLWHNGQQRRRHARAVNSYDDAMRAFALEQESS
jgi:hypothetical protein